MLEEVRDPEPPIRLSALFYEPGPAGAGGRASCAGSATIVVGVGTGAHEPLAEHARAAAMYRPTTGTSKPVPARAPTTDTPLFETNPDGVFWALQGRRLPAKRHPYGMQLRIEELEGDHVDRRGRRPVAPPHRGDRRARVRALRAPLRRRATRRWMDGVVLPGTSLPHEFSTRGVMPPVERISLTDPGIRFAGFWVFRATMRKLAIVAGAVLAVLRARRCGAGEATAKPPQHVFVIVLENEDADTTFGPASPAPYLAQTLTAQGAFVPGYYGIGHNSLDDYIAMVSGQAPNIETQADCPLFTDFLPGTPGLRRPGRRAGLRLSRERADRRRPARGARPELEGLHGGHGRRPGPRQRDHVRAPGDRHARPDPAGAARPTSTRRGTTRSSTSTRSSTAPPARSATCRSTG